MVKNIEKIIKEGEILLRTQPGYFTRPDNIHQGETRRGWCGSVVGWTESILGKKELGPIFVNSSNWLIEELKEGRPARKIYDELIKMLEDGWCFLIWHVVQSKKYDLIQEIRRSSFMLPQIALAKNLTVETDFKSECGPLLNPFVLNNWIVSFDMGGVATIHPVAKNILFNLDVSKEKLKEKIEDIGIKKPYEQDVFLDIFSNEKCIQPNKWEHVYSNFESQIVESEEAKKAAPWFWLGINLASFQAITNHMFWFEVRPGSCLNLYIRRIVTGHKYGEPENVGLYPTPEYTKVIADSLSYCLSQIKEMMFAGHKPRKKRYKTKVKPLTTNQALLFKTYIDSGYNVSETAKRLNLNRKTVTEALKAIEKKTGKQIVGLINQKAKTIGLPVDRRGQEVNTEDDSVM